MPILKQERIPIIIATISKKVRKMKIFARINVHSKPTPKPCNNTIKITIMNHNQKKRIVHKSQSCTTITTKPNKTANRTTHTLYTHLRWSWCGSRLGTCLCGPLTLPRLGWWRRRCPPESTGPSSLWSGEVWGELREVCGEWCVVRWVVEVTIWCSMVTTI